MRMVKDCSEYLPPEHVVDMLQVHHHARLLIDHAANCDLDHIVVAVVGRAGAEDLAILLVGPVLAAQDVSGREGGAAGDAHVGGHGSIRKLAPESGDDSVEASQTMIRATSAGCSAGPSTPALRSIGVSTGPRPVA